MKQIFLRSKVLATALTVAMVGPLKAVDAVSVASNHLPAVTNQLSLDNLVNEAMANNPELNFYRAEIAAARGGRRTAAAWANPEVSAELGQKRVKDSSGTQLGEGAAWAVSVNQTFEYPGRLSLRKAIANRDLQLAELGFSQFKLALTSRVRMLGYQVFIAQEKLEAAREVAARFQALTDVLVQRDPAGITPLLETRIIEANTITLQRQASEASLTAQAAVLELNQLRGQSSGGAIRVSVAEFNFHEAPPLELLLEIARTNAFELRLRQAELEQQGFKVSLAKNERFPAVTVGPFIAQEKAADKETIVGVGISVPLPLWNRNTGNIEIAQAREQQAQTSLQLAQRDVERRVTESALALQVKLAEINQWRADAVTQFTEAAELADRHYRLGAVPITTYVELQKQYLEAIAAMLDTRQETLVAAQTLELLTGISSLVKSNLNSTNHE